MDFVTNDLTTIPTVTLPMGNGIYALRVFGDMSVLCYDAFEIN